MRGWDEVEINFAVAQGILVNRPACMAGSHYTQYVLYKVNPHGRYDLHVLLMMLDGSRCAFRMVMSCSTKGPTKTQQLPLTSSLVLTSLHLMDVQSSKQTQNANRTSRDAIICLFPETLRKPVSYSCSPPVRFASLPFSPCFYQHNPLRPPPPR